MKNSRKRNGYLGISFVGAFLFWTMLIQKVDVQPMGVRGTMIGFATLNGWFHKITGVHMVIYHITDWLGLVPILSCMFLGFVGLIQWIRRRSLRKVDCDILCLGIYYVVVIAAYLLFEMMYKIESGTVRFCLIFCQTTRGALWKDAFSLGAFRCFLRQALLLSLKIL